jgi:hypothetical protein
LGAENGGECPAKRLRRQAYKFSSRKPRERGENST